MCTSSSTVAYGLTVRAAPLMFAADAWSRLEPPLSFFDLLLLRRRTNTLITSRMLGKSPITRVPTEIWDEIRRWLIRKEMARSERKFLARLFCDTCEPDLPLLNRSWRDFEEEDICADHDDGVVDWFTENLWNWSDDQLSAINTLLSEFGLTLTCQGPVRVADDWPGLNSLALISIPSRFVRGSSSDAIISAECGGDTGPDEHTIVDISFKLPSYTQERFTRLIRLFDLEIVESSINKISSRPEKAIDTKDKKGKRTKDAKSSGVKDRVTKEIKPRWMLWTTCERSW